MINIAKLLKDAPKGMKLYSPLFGEVEFIGVFNDGKTIKTKAYPEFSKSFFEDGRYFSFPDAECLLFPSKDCRTWEGWKVPVEPKFKVGDWVVKKDGTPFYGGNYAEQITLIEGDKNLKCIWFSSGTWLREKDIRLWSHEDAKDGDVLAANECYVIFKEIDGLNIKCYCTYHYMGFNPSFHIDTLQNKTAFNPATKEQRELLFKKMKEAGYKWDADKKELRRRTIEPTFKVGDEIFRHARNEYFKIKGIEKDSDTVWYVTTRTRIADNDKHIGEVVRINAFYQDGYSIAPKPHYDIANFKPFDKVLVRDNDRGKWRPSIFSYHIKGRQTCYPFCCIGNSFSQCIPFEGNEHLLGTTDPCDEQYINW